MRKHSISARVLDSEENFAILNLKKTPKIAFLATPVPVAMIKCDCSQPLNVLGFAWNFVRITSHPCEMGANVRRSKIQRKCFLGTPYCTCIAQSTTTFQVVHHRRALVKLYQCTKFRVASSKFPESKGAYAIMHVHSAHAVHVHYAPHHQMQCTIESCTLNSTSVPNLVSPAQNFLEPEDPLE